MFKAEDLIRGRAPSGEGYRCTVEWMTLGKVVETYCRNGAFLMKVHVLEHPDCDCRGTFEVPNSEEIFSLVRASESADGTQILLSRSGETLNAIRMENGTPVRSVRVSGPERGEFDFVACAVRALRALGFSEHADRAARGQVR